MTTWQVIFTLAAFSGIFVESFPTQESFGDAGKIAEPALVDSNNLAMSSSLLELSEFSHLPSLTESDSSFTLSQEKDKNPIDAQTLHDENQLNSEMLNGLHKIWLRAARILALRPDLLRWVSSLTPDQPTESPQPSITEETINLIPVVVENSEQEIPIQDTEILSVESATVAEEQFVIEDTTELPQMIEIQPELILESQNDQITTELQDSEILPVEALSITEVPLDIQVSEDIVNEPEIVPTFKDMSQIVTDPENVPQSPATELLVPERILPLIEPESKQSQAKLKLDLFKERNFKKGKTLLDESQFSSFSNINSNFPSYSYSFRHIPVHG